MMKIAIPTTGNLLDEYLNSCEVFTIFTIDDSNAIVDTELICTPEGCDCKNNIPLTMEQKGVSVMISYKLPDYAEEICAKHGVKVYQGYSGDVNVVIAKFLQWLNR